MVKYVASVGSPQFPCEKMTSGYLPGRIAASRSPSASAVPVRGFAGYHTTVSRTRGAPVLTEVLVNVIVVTPTARPAPCAGAASSRQTRKRGNRRMIELVLHGDRTRKREIP